MTKLTALVWSDTQAYFFRGGEYARYNVSNDAVDAGYPQPITSGWKGVFPEDIDAAVVWNNGRAYFFSGSEYTAYDVAADAALEGYPKAIADSWPGVFPDGIDAVVPWGDGKAYFFSGDQVTRYDMVSDTADEGYPKAITDEFAQVFEAVDSVVRWPNGKVLFFSDGQFLAYDPVGGVQDAGYPVDLSEWPAGLGGGSTAGPSSEDSGTSGTSETSAPSGTDRLSERRKKLIDELLPAVVPSAYPDQKFMKLTFGLTKDNPNVKPGYTTCGSMPQYVTYYLGLKSISGTYAVRTLSQGKGWVEAGGDVRPKPGDIYALLDQDATDRANGGISHVGVIVDASTDEWKTADSGQGDGWAAAYVTRQYDPEAGTLSGEIVGTTGPRPARVIAGWIDLDAFPSK